MRMTESSHVFEDVGRHEFQAQMVGCWRIPFPCMLSYSQYLHSCSGSLVSSLHFSLTFFQLWLLCLFIPSAAFDMTHQRSRNVFLGYNTRTQSDLTTTLTAWTKCSYEGKKAPIKTSRPLCYTNSSKPGIPCRAQMLQNLIRSLMGRSSLQAVHSLVTNNSICFELHARQVPCCRLYIQITLDEFEGILDSAGNQASHYCPKKIFL